MQRILKAYKLDYQIKSFMNAHLININNTTNFYMVEWIQAVNEIQKNKVKFKGQGIKEFLVPKKVRKLKIKIID